MAEPSELESLDSLFAEVCRLKHARIHTLLKALGLYCGQAVRADVQQVWRRLEEEAFAGFTLKERALLRQFFLHIRENLRCVTASQ